MIEILGVDPRATVAGNILIRPPLPTVSKQALARVKDRIPPPTACHCCGGRVRLVNNSEIYHGNEFGEWPFAYLCAEHHCGAYVGIHKYTDLPLGTMADARTREARTKAKNFFLTLSNIRFNRNRNKSYPWLAEQMGIEQKYCHFGIFTLEQCNQVMEILKPQPEFKKWRS